MDLLIIAFIASAILSIPVAWAAGQRGRSAGGWFLLSLLISPIIALLVLLVAGPGRASSRSSIPGLDLSRLTDADLDAIRRHQAAQRAQHADPLRLGNPQVTILRADGTQENCSLLQLQDAWKAGQVQLTEHYWDPEADQWLELSAHPRLR